MKEEKIIRYINIIRNQFKKAAEKSMSEAGIFQAQHHILQFLGASQCSSQREIADALGVSTVAVSNCLKRLEARGYIKKSSNEEDGRSKTVSLSRSGMQARINSLKSVKELNKAAFAGFSEEEIDLLEVFLERIYANLSRERAGEY
ncbi:MAG: MarR family winged helix-turn-helix transcriptional regulator [Oscillospiraceae bacterium]|jgi:DNA-binding MarR family transcriptional regulator